MTIMQGWNSVAELELSNFGGSLSLTPVCQKISGAKLTPAFLMM